MWETCLRFFAQQRPDTESNTRLENSSATFYQTHHHAQCYPWGPTRIITLVSEMTYNVSMGTLNPTIPYHSRSVAYLGGHCACPPFGMRFFWLFKIINLSNFWVNFREYILKIALTRSIFQSKMHQIAFGGLALPGPAGQLTALPRFLAGLRGAYF